MKKIARIIFAAAAMISVFSACVREPEMIPSAGEQTVLFTAEPIETRTAFTDPTGDSYPVLWTANDKQVKVMLNMTEAKDVDVTPSDDFKTASFVASFKDTTTYTFFVVSPASAYLSHYEKVSGEVAYRLGMTVPSAQTPTAKSVDEAAQILIAKSETTTGTTAPEKVSLSFKHWTAYGKFSLTNLALGDAKIEAVDLTAEEPWAGRWYYFFADQTSKVNSGSNTITVNTTSASDIWFACAPVDLSGKKLTVKVKTDKGTLTKEITMPADRKFQSGKIACFNVDMKGIEIQEPQVYELVTKTDDLLYNSKIIIAAASSEYDFAIGTTQNGNNRKAEGVTRDGIKILDPSSSVEIFSLEAGTESGTYAFKGQDGKYIYAPGGGNYLRSTETKDAAASWAVTFKEGYVILESKAADKTQRFLRYNKSNTVFSCYTETSSVRDSVALYKLVGSGESSFPTEKKESGLWLENTSLTVTVGESVEVAVDYDKMDAGYFTDGGSVTFSVDDATIATVDEDGMAFGVKAGTCTVTVTAAETTNYRAATKTCSITVTDADKDKTIADILALAAGKLDISTSTVIEERVTLQQAFVVAVGGSNFVIQDPTGVIMAYKKESGVAVGDAISIAGALQNYYGIAELNAGSITVLYSGAPVDHGAPVEFTESAIAAYLTAPVTQYCKISGTLPADGSAYMTVGKQNVALYDKDMYADKYGMVADVYGYAIGRGSKGQVNFINVEIKEDASAPFLTVDATSKTWAADATDSFTVNVSVQTGGSWTYTASGMDWATVAKDGNKLIVTPKAANTSSTAKEGTVTLTNSADATKTATVEFKQSGVVSGSTYVLDSEAIKTAHADAWKYDSGNQTITATDGSAWICYNTYANKNQVTVQMRPTSNSTITTPAVPTGKRITRLAVSCAWNNDGSGGFETTRTMQILDGSTVVVASVTGKDLYEGIEIPGNHTQLSFGPTASGSGTMYVLNATVTFE